MSLKVWLPLNGTLENKGVSNITPTLMGSGITYTAGKIGNAATFPNACSSCIHMPGLKLQILTWTCWFKCNGKGSGTSQRILSEGRDTGSVGTNIWLSKAGTTLYWSAHKVSGSVAVTLNTWYHVALTCDGTKVHLYLNGTEQGTGTAYTSDSDYAQSNDRFVLGKMAYLYTSTGNYFPFNGQLNDVRIYDHCLSTAEVHEISQGLVLHYKLDNNGHRNLISSNAAKTVTLGASATNAYTGYWYLDTYVKAQGILKEGTPYTVIYDYSVNTLTSTSAYFYSQINTARCAPSQSAIGIRTANTGTVKENFVMTAAQATYSSSFRFRIRFYGAAGDSVTISNLRICLGTYQECDYVSDCSGYGHNGTIVGSPTLSSDTARYSTSTYMDATNTTNHIDCGQMPSTVQTISFWFKKTGNSNFVVMAEPSSGLMFAPVGSYAVVKVATSNQTCYAISSPYYIDGQWNHIVVQKDGTTYKLWTNGVQRGSSGSNYYRHDGTNLWLFNRNYNASYAANGQISDFRVYTTLLSETDIKQLYEMGAKVDNKQNLHIYEAIEIQPTIKLTKQGQMKVGEFQENTTTRLYETNQIVETNNLIEF